VGNYIYLAVKWVYFDDGTESVAGKISRILKTVKSVEIFSCRSNISYRYVKIHKNNISPINN
jgi:hypothetical protein